MRNARRWRAGLAATMCCVALLGAQPAQASDETCFSGRANAARAAAGRPRLRIMGDLAAIAERQSRRMAADGTIYHNRDLGSEISGRWWAAGENVGMGPSCSSVHDAFMSSPGHRANILDRDYNELGVGVTWRDDTLYVSEVFAGRPGLSVSRSRPREAPRRPERAAEPRPVAFPSRSVLMLLRLLELDRR